MEHSQSKLAIIDIGSNTIRLVIYNKNEFGKFKEKENFKSAARLRHYLNKNGILETEGINLLVKILKGFKEVINFHGVEMVKCVATATIRQAQNKKDVLANVKEQTGFEVNILSESEEAFYGYFAVIHTTPLTEGVTVDLGGGSTEITYFKNRQLQYSHSFPFGAVSLKEQFIKGEKITAEEKESLARFINQSFRGLPWLNSLQVPIIAIGGSARNIAQIDQNFKKYPLSGIHQYPMKPKDLNQLLQTVEMLTARQLEKLEGLAKDRADIIMPALETFSVLCEYVQADKFMFSRKGLRDGIFLREYEGRKCHTDTDKIVKESIDELVYINGISTKHSYHVAFLAEQMYTQLEKVCDVKLASEIKKMIDYSAHVYNLGNYIDSDESSQHTFYLLANKSIDGLGHKERLKLALIASFKSKALLKQYCHPFINWFTRDELQEIRIAGALTKLAAALDESKRGIVKGVTLTLDKTNENEDITLFLDCSGDAFLEKYQIDKQIKHLEKAIKKRIQIIYGK
jgi:exopolyphosphatase/guanosine-5'-triphosphate,3'-diphosphate pyrophosphatase